MREILECQPAEGGLAGLRLVARQIQNPYLKDYDAIPGCAPVDWARDLDLGTWAFFAARSAGVRVGGAVVVRDAPTLGVQDGVALLWDLRVARDARGTGVGRALFHAAASWAAARGCAALTAETQNVNVAACRFYVRMGCTLQSVDRFAYPELPDEVRLVWRADPRATVQELDGR